MGFFGAAVVGGLGLLASSKSAKADRDQARREREKTRLELLRHRRNVRRVRGQQQVKFVASGVIADTGSALDIIADIQEQGALDGKIIEAGGEARASASEAAARVTQLTGVKNFVGGFLGG